MAYCALREFQGQQVVYIGEGRRGRTSNDEFHEELASAWTLTGTLDIPQWTGMHDELRLYQRRVTSRG